MLNQKLSQKLLQKLSPQQIQLMKLLQVPTMSLEQRIKQEIESNPALEEAMEEDESHEEAEFDELDEAPTEKEEREKDDDNDDYLDDEIDLSSYYEEDEIASYKLKGTAYNDDEEDRSVPIPVTETFQDKLNNQLGLLNLSEKDYLIAEQIIGSIDDDGYLRRELEAIVDDLAFSQNVIANEDDVETILLQVQNFDPPGVGARDLQECLLLQLKREDQNDIHVEHAIKILTDYFEEFTKKHYEKLLKSLNIDEEELKLSIDVILKLNPKPGSAYASGTREQYVVPDFLLSNINGELELTLNSRNAPDLRISDTYKDMFRDYDKTKKKTKDHKEAILFIKQKIDSAKWFIDAIKQRQSTMLRTMRAILEYQYDYFLSGDETKLRPMILKDIAEKIDMDISTVSRVANSKYVQTEFGTFPLKSFFSESLQTESGEEVSTREVKKILQDLIDNESKRRPLSDQKLTELLNEKGYNIARRTVAKYREQLNIPVARLRKEL